MSVTKRKDSGSYRADIYLHGQKQESRSFRTAELAKAWHDIRRAEMLRGDVGIKERKRSITFRELATRYLMHCERTARKGTFRYYRHRLRRYIVPYFKDRLIDSITRSVVRDYLDERMEQGMKAASHAKELQIIQRLLNWAVENELLEANPTISIRPPKVDRATEPHFYTPDDVRRILGAISGNALGLMLTAFRTGMRQSEIAAFEHSWCAMDTNLLNIPPVAKDHEARTIPLTQDLKAWLLSRDCRTGHVFVSERAPYRPLRDFRKLLRRIEGATGFHVKLHDCRHTYASFLLASGVPIHEVKTALGHASITTTMIYAHLSPDYLAKVRAALEAVGGAGASPVRLVG